MAVVASAPGKVLMTGGYLILERPNAGVVLSTNARFYAIVKPLYDEIKHDSWAWVWTDVKLTSPQLSRESMYKLSLKNLMLQCVSSRQVLLWIISMNQGTLVLEQAVPYVIAAALALFDKDKTDALNKLLLQGLDITILGCNDFYSYRNQIEARGLPLTPESLAALPPFTSITFNAEEQNGQNCKPEVAKTGLGSSAAMTTAVVAALLHYLGVVDLSPLSKFEGSADLDVVHIIAQTAHCIAQGKVGSGFDVSSAVYGSHRYVRFSPDVLSSAQDAAKGTPLQEVMAAILKGKWDHERTKFSLPPLMNLLLGEPGTGGSSTPSMVGAVKSWQKSDPAKAQETWRNKLAEENCNAYKCVIDKCSEQKSEKWIEQSIEPSEEAVVKALLGARSAMVEIRNLMHQMGEAAGVPIEPESQTRLLDATMDMEGVLLAGVPGAGGFDAVFAVTLGDSGNNVAKAWSSLNVLALLVREDPHGVSLETADPRTEEITATVSAVHIE
uniref:phosphomevalonate kinase n=1 Tax=Salix viminalis TaxID=40686 RepID=A0A6N2JYT4_SALVM